MPYKLLAPGRGFTIYGELLRDVSVARPIIATCDVVGLHTNASDDDPKHADTVRSFNPSARVWLCLPANRFVPMSDAEAERQARYAARTARACGAEVLEFNGEGASNPDASPRDWTARGEELAKLAARCELLVRVARDECPELIILWTSHDMPGFALPWRKVAELVDAMSHQHYPAEKGRTVYLTELRERIARSQGRWEMLAEAGKVSEEIVPGGARTSPYFQGHGHSLAALCWALDNHASCRLWAFPGSWDTAGTLALSVMRRVWSEQGPAVGAVARLQAARGLRADGVIGTVTRRALGV